MAIHYRMTQEGNLLTVEASGYDENREDVELYGLAVVTACQQGQPTRVLCLEHDLEYRLGTLDIYKSAEFIASQAPRLGKVAIVCNEKYLGDAQFWETVAVNRGLIVRVFTEVEKARRWLA